MTKRQKNELRQLRRDLIELSLKVQKAIRDGNKKAEAKFEKKRETALEKIERVKQGNSR